MTRSDIRRFWDMSAVVFDMDGVVTDTAHAHAESWACMFNEYLSNHLAPGVAQRPFSEEDYLRYIDGKPRYDGVRSFLESRAIELPEGTVNDDPTTETICGLGNRKNVKFLETLRAGGAEAYPSTVRLVEELHERTIPAAVITSSKNCEDVLRSAGVWGMFAVKVDGNDCAALGLAGKPAADIFLEAARRLGIPPRRTVVVEDARAGVEAGHRGDFGMVIGVDRSGQSEALMASGADFVVSDLGELLPDPVDD